MYLFVIYLSLSFAFSQSQSVHVHSYCSIVDLFGFIASRGVACWPIVSQEVSWLAYKMKSFKNQRMSPCELQADLSQWHIPKPIWTSQRSTLCLLVCSTYQCYNTRYVITTESGKSLGADSAGLGLLCPLCNIMDCTISRLVDTHKDDQLMCTNPVLRDGLIKLRTSSQGPYQSIKHGLH